VVGWGGGGFWAATCMYLAGYMHQCHAERLSGTSFQVIYVQALHLMAVRAHSLVCPGVGGGGGRGVLNCSVKSMVKTLGAMI